MKLIVSHAQPDFDALAGLALARLAHPGARAACLGHPQTDVEAFINLYRDLLELQDAQDIDLDEVSELIVVDTSDPERIAPFDQLLGRVPVTLYDHHPQPKQAIPAARGQHRDVGATATILTLLLASKDLDIPPALASLGLLAIHQDTGSFSYPGTRSEDHRAAAYLLACGANLGFIGEFLHAPFRAEHRAFFQRLLDAARQQSIAGHMVVVASLEDEAYVPGIAPLCTDLLELYDADAALLAARMDGRTAVIGRAKGDAFDLNAALADALGGGGHPGAAFARSDLAPGEALERVVVALERHATAGREARDLMRAPVRTITESATLADAQALLVRHGHSGLPVVDDQGKLTGVISRRDLDSALQRGLARSEVRGFMSHPVVTADPNTSQRDLERLIEDHNIGRIPILDGNALIGIVTRTDLLAERHTRTSVPGQQQDKVADILAALPPAAVTTLERASRLLEHGHLYLVGGSVRDGLLGVGIQDIDLAVEGQDATYLGGALQRELGGVLSCHLNFGTCTLTLPTGLVLDLATAREESYRHPGALPDVSPSTLRKDLARRDFTVNALAVRLSPEPPVLVDPFGGLEDLEHRILRSLRPDAFTEDPTRILRGARLAGRLGLELDTETEQHMRSALTGGGLAGVSASRLRAELELTLAETRVVPALAILEDLGALSAMFHMHADEPLLAALDKMRGQAPVPDESYLLALLLSVPKGRLGAVLERFHWPRRLAEAVRVLAHARRADAVSEQQLEDSSPALRAALSALSPGLRQRLEEFERVPRQQKLRGQDVLDLGLPQGPAVGEILREVAEARARKRVGSFEEELELARALVARRLDR